MEFAKTIIFDVMFLLYKLDSDYSSKLNSQLS